MLQRQSLSLLAVFAALTTTSARATEIQLSYAVLERLISQQVFTEEGRKYVKGTKSDRCSFAYLENPKIGSASGQVVIKAKFTGRTAIDMFGRCVGLGDAFDLTVNGAPYYDKGKVAFKDISVQTSRDSYYIRKVRQALIQSLGKQFEYNIQNDAKKLMEQQSPDPSAPFKREMIKFDVTQIRAAEHAIILTVDFILAVK